MIELKTSKVKFTPEGHRYTLDGKALCGITTLIREVLDLGRYPGASAYARDFLIPRAANYGTSVHQAIQEFEETGEKVVNRPMDRRFATIDADYWDVECELENYIRHREGYKNLASEYLVTDGKCYASAIDNVWMDEETEEIWLIDTKTNNVVTYPGGERGLKYYLSWQLSIYAYLFEKQNPALKVKGLACNWLRHEKSAFWEIERIPDEKIKKLLAVKWAPSIDPGEKVFSVPERLQADLVGDYYDKVMAPMLDYSPAELHKIAWLTRTIEELTAELDAAKSALREKMEEEGCHKLATKAFTVTLGKPTVSRAFDSKEFQKVHPEMYDLFVKETQRKGAFTIRLNKDLTI